MVNHQIASYFHEWLQKGYTLDELKSELLKQGYPHDEIEAVAQTVNHPHPPQIPQSPSHQVQENQYGDRTVFNDEKPILLLKPRIIAGILPKIVITLMVLLFIGWTPLMFLFSISGLFQSSTISIPIILFAFSLFSIILPYMNLRNREYRFFHDKAEFYEGFLNINRKIVRYDRVTDISFNKNVWERIWGTGSILLNTAGGPNKELKISYIKNSESVYRNIQNLIKANPGHVGTERYYTNK